MIGLDLAVGTPAAHQHPCIPAKDALRESGITDISPQELKNKILKALDGMRGILHGEDDPLLLEATELRGVNREPFADPS
ncbi:hypothetical protein, partial [Sansalvadorimonas verongulae]|uniref:hypothetical protein n=1 Tax=Sansalvadorimonas verongulae TaxID=2172824 RepID=UPI0012BC052F